MKRYVLSIQYNTEFKPLPADKSVYVADAGPWLPSLRSPCGRHLKKPSFAHHPLHSAVGEASGRNGVYDKTLGHVWILAHRNRPRVCVVTLRWNISLWDQICTEPVPRGSTVPRRCQCKARKVNKQPNVFPKTNLDPVLNVVIRKPGFLDSQAGSLCAEWTRGGGAVNLDKAFYFCVSPLHSPHMQTHNVSSTLQLPPSVFSV